MFDFIRSYFTMKREDNLSYQKAQILSFGEDKLNVPEHWINELFLLPEEWELKIAFYQNSKPISVYIPKSIYKKEIDSVAKKTIVSKLYFHILKNKLHSDMVFKYNPEKDTFVPCVFAI